MKKVRKLEPRYSESSLFGILEFSWRAPRIPEYVETYAQPPLRDDTEVGGGKREVHGGAGQRVERGPASSPDTARSRARSALLEEDARS